MGLFRILSHYFIKLIKIRNRLVVALTGENPIGLYDNIVVTKHFCYQQLQKFPEKSPASIFRTTDCTRDGKKLFGFKMVEIDGESNMLADWYLDPLKALPDLFLEQLNHKKSIITEWDKEHNKLKGEIIVVQYDDTVLDGTSEWESKGLFDIYDLPPIDTWVYLTKDDNNKYSLYAWIPKPYIALAKNAIEVNCLDLIKWVEW